MNELEERIAVLEAFVDSLKANATIPYEVDRSFRERFSDITGFQVSNKSLDSEDVTVVNGVNFGANSTQTTQVLNDPDAWVKTTVGGQEFHLPAYTS